ncbi:MAG: hypothetical protein EA405_07090, partial [Rhodospirillales bacterium]
MNRRAFLIGASVTAATATTPIVPVGFMQAQAETGRQTGSPAPGRQLVHAVDYATLRKTGAAAGALALVAAAGPDGATFTATDADIRDNGGTVIESATAGVVWVRDGRYNTADTPMRLSWFERTTNGPLIRAGDEIGPALERIFASSSPSTDTRLKHTPHTVGLWRFDGNREAEPKPAVGDAAIYLHATDAVALDCLDVPSGIGSVHLTGPVVLAANNECAVRIRQAFESRTAVVIGDGIFIPMGKAYGVVGDKAQCSLTIDGTAQTL